MITDYDSKKTLHLKNRRPLRCCEATNLSSMTMAQQSFAPKLDENFNVCLRGGNAETRRDKEKSELKSLTRQVKRERKSVVRELKLKHRAISVAKTEAKNESLQEQKVAQNQIQHWLNEQTATFNEQVAKGGELLKGAGKSYSKRKRVN